MKKYTLFLILISLVVFCIGTEIDGNWKFYSNVKSFDLLFENGQVFINYSNGHILAGAYRIYENSLLHFNINEDIFFCFMDGVVYNGVGKISFTHSIFDQVHSALLPVTFSMWRVN